MSRPPSVLDIPRPAPEQRSARQIAYDGLRAGILRGDYAPGAFIEEASACAATGVSRTPVREALARLGAEGFLVLHPRRGAMVKPITTEELTDLHEVRLMVESHAVRRICESQLPVPEALHQICAAHDEIPEGDHLAFTELNHRFHEAVIAAAGNQVLIQVFGNLRANLMRAAMVSFQMGVVRSTESGQHRALVAALQAHDTAAALEVVERHLSRMPRLVSAMPGGAASAANA